MDMIRTIASNNDYYNDHDHHDKTMIGITRRCLGNGWMIVSQRASHIIEPYCDIKLLSYIVLMVIWFTSAVYGTIRNKEIVEHFPYPALLTASHFACGTFIDWAAMRARGLSIPFRFDLFLACVPVSILLTFSKTFTFVSYGHVPASLTHTIKSSSPVFSVLLTRLLYNKWPSLPIVLSLVPITAGVALSAVTEIDFEFVGFLAALISAIANVGHAMYSKGVLKKSQCGPLILHMYTSIASTLILLPYALFQEATEVFGRLYPVHEDEGRGDDGVAVPEVLVLPIWAFLLSNALHYAQNMSSLYVLSRVSTLRYQVTNTLKRALTIMVSIMHFHNQVTMMNALGMGMALTGFFWYGMAKKSESASCATTNSQSDTNTSTTIITTNGHVHADVSINVNGNGTIVDGTIDTIHNRGHNSNSMSMNNNSNHMGHNSTNKNNSVSASAHIHHDAVGAGHHTNGYEKKPYISSLLPYSSMSSSLSSLSPSSIASMAAMNGNDQTIINVVGINDKCQALTPPTPTCSGTPITTIVYGGNDGNAENTCTHHLPHHNNNYTNSPASAAASASASSARINLVHPAAGGASSSTAIVTVVPTIRIMIQMKDKQGHQ